MGEPERIFREVAELWTSQQWDRWQRTCHPVYRFDPGIGSPRDVAATVSWSRAAFDAFPDYEQRIDHVIVDERGVTGIITATATFTGPLRLAGRTFTPTGKRFELPYVKTLQLDPAGLVVRDWQHMNYQAMAAVA